MTRLVRLNEVQYSETEERTAELMAQGFELEPLEAEEHKVKKPEDPKEPKGDKGKSKKTDEGGAEDNPSPEGDEQH
ncbi:hypothetical protein [uncultured Selenomonas sp.]|uniref:hypothetical protein n=1 Tax=uncultured Selenomonas sp. TaxID=159275 RepID=UPI0028D27D2D|nr:hypothetical protein [uncultured Selenomonas sp.]